MNRVFWYNENIKTIEKRRSMPEGVTLFQDTLIKSLKFGFIDNIKFQEGGYSPQILINDPESKRYVLKDIQEELSKCQAFYISVAFITQSGIALIKSQLSDLMDKGIKGKILISPYLDFNDPVAMQELLKLKNVEVRLTPESLQMHAKFYLFEHQGKQVLISGSSNLTHNALKINYEWNIKLTSTYNGELIQATKKEFEKIWEKSDVLTIEKIDSYARKRQKTIRVDQIREEEIAEYQVTSIEPNKMQNEALKGLQAIRDSGKKKALVISATGTGKTYLSAFDVQQFEPKRMLFIVHREQILQKSLKDFQKVLQFPESEGLIYHSGADLTNKKYIFATIQTLSRDYHLNLFSEDYFDYILIDEVHKAGADSYKKVMAHFHPEFFLGMTATPERTDGQNIYELFDYNIAYEIRLQDALDNDMLCPFIYFGVKDIEIDGHLIDEKTNISNLTSNERVKHILQKIDFYGVSGEKVKGLIFCSSKQEAHELASKLNQNGKVCRALTGDDNIETRNEVVSQLEKGELDYILTVDIFNEGIDIPSVNQVVMLRNTQSSIVFVQQLGRGLRKHESKEYVTIIDFIGNYKNNYLIPIALFGDKSMNKDNYRRELREPNILNGLTTINFEEVAKLKPDVVIIWDYQPEVAKKLKELGIPAVSIKYGTLEDIQNGIRLLGKILDKPEQAEALISYHKDSEAYFKQKNASALPNKPKVLYLQNKNLTVAGNNSVNQLMITMTGGENAAKDTKGSWTKVSMEEIMTWDPDIIILSNFDSIRPDDIYQDKLEGQNWSNIKAVKTHRVYKAPMGIYRWDAPNVETPLMMKWMGQLIQPDTFNDYILRDDLKQFYNTFYHYNLTDSEINTILNISINNTPTF